MEMNNGAGLERVSIITISFNQAEFINSCLESIFSLDDENYEHIVVDAGSTDGTVEILEEFSRRSLDYKFRYISETDDGPSDALNKGFNMASGDIFCFVNSDDLLHVNALSIVRRRFKVKEVSLLQASGYVINKEGETIRSVAAVPMTIESFQAMQHVIFQPSLFFRKKVFDAVHFNIDNRCCWDMEFFVMALLKGFKIDWEPRPISNFRLYNESKSGSQADLKEVRAVRERLLEQVETKSYWKSLFIIQWLRKRSYQLISFPYILLGRMGY